jgi:aminoglycoside phosphotransferase (APT) family kinase protein
MVWPRAEVATDAAVVGRLLADQHPDLADLRLHRCDAGWDNVMWRLGDELAVRIPRRAAAAPLIGREQRWLPELAPTLPLQVPVPVRIGHPSGTYPWSWSVVPWLDGESGDRATVTDGAVTAERLGSFLRVLHRAAPDDAPFNEWRSGPVASRTDTFEERMAKLAGQVDSRALRRVWRAALESAPHTGPPKWVHGDLHPANILIRDGAVGAVIDFGDLCAGDPAVDLGGAWMLLPPDARPRFWSAYGTPSPDCDLVRRSEGWAVLFGLMLLDIGLEGRPTYATVGRATLERMVEQSR